MQRHSKKQRRGFALLFIVMIVAVVAVAAAALLDIVEVDLLIAGEHRRSAIAGAIAEGAVKEFQADINKVELLPTGATLNLTTRYAGRDFAGDFVRDPDGLAGPSTLMTEANSAYVRNNAAATAVDRQGYTADIRLLRTGPVINSGMNTVRSVLYELRAESSVAGGSATQEVRVQLYNRTAAQAGVVGQIHGR